MKTLQDIIEFNERNREKEMPFFEQEFFLKAQAKGPLADMAYVEALAKNHRLSRDEGIDAVMNEHKLDAVVSPTTGPAQILRQILLHLRRRLERHGVQMFVEFGQQPDAIA